MSCSAKVIGTISKRRSACRPMGLCLPDRSQPGAGRFPNAICSDAAYGRIPIYTPTASHFGIVIINVDLRQAFARIRSEMRGGIQIYVVNERGDYLLHPDPNREFGFEFGRPIRLQDDIPEFARLLADEDTAPQVMTDRTGARFGVGWEIDVASGRTSSERDRNHALCAGHCGRDSNSRLQSGRRTGRRSLRPRFGRGPRALTDKTAGPDDQGGRRILPMAQ